MPRYIDADIAHEEIEKLQTELESNNDTIWKKNKPIYKGLCYARGIINETPTADVAEVVRCGNCKYYHQGVVTRCTNPKGLKAPSDYGYCSYGKRKAMSEFIGYMSDKLEHNKRKAWREKKK